MNGRTTEQSRKAEGDALRVCRGQENNVHMVPIDPNRLAPNAILSMLFRGAFTTGGVTIDPCIGVFKI